MFRGDVPDGAITGFMDKPFDDGPVGSYRIFFWNGFDDNRAKFSLLWTLL
jgi:hypothetical protein